MTRLDLIRRTALAFGLAVALSACGDSVEPTPPAAKPALTPAPTPAPSPPPAPAVAPAPAPADPAAGGLAYQTYCAVCHGVGGDGKTPFGQALDPPPTAHNDGGYMNTLSDDYLFEVIKQGGASVGKSPAMAPWGGSLSDAQIRDVVAFIRSLAVPPYPGTAAGTGAGT